MGDSSISLFGPPQVRLWNENMSHWQHTQTTQFFGRVEDDRWETTGHLGIQTNLNTRLDLNKNKGKTKC